MYHQEPYHAAVLSRCWRKVESVTYPWNIQTSRFLLV